MDRRVAGNLRGGGPRAVRPRDHAVFGRHHRPAERRDGDPGGLGDHDLHHPSAALRRSRDQSGGRPDDPRGGRSGHDHDGDGRDPRDPARLRRRPRAGCDREAPRDAHVPAADRHLRPAGPAGYPQARLFLAQVLHLFGGAHGGRQDQGIDRGVRPDHVAGLRPDRDRHQHDRHDRRGSHAVL